MNKSKIVNVGSSKYKTVNPKYWVDLTPDTGSGSGNNKCGVTDMSYFCYKGCRVDELSTIDTSNGTIFKSMFEECSNITEIPEFDTSNGTDFSRMFQSCTNLTTIPLLDTSNGTNFSSMFRSCIKLTTIPMLDTSNGTYFDAMFQACNKITTIPLLDTSNGTQFSNMFSNCSVITTIPLLDTSNGTDFGSMFQNCSSLTTIPRLDINKGFSFNEMFSSCSKLTNLRLYNIRNSIQIGSGTSWGHLLTVDSLVHTIKELCKVTYQNTLTMGNSNLEKISGLYCKVLDDTTEKIEMELCESTDTGAITLSAYAALKNWSLN